MATLIFTATLLCVAVGSLAYPYNPFNPMEFRNNLYPFPFLSRDEWGASPPKSVAILTNPAPLVVIHHTAIPDECHTRTECIKSMRSMQNSHQNYNKWSDIGYNFAVGGDGAVYEGRGWTHIGAHAQSYNSKSIGIALIGNFVSKLPPAHQVQATKNLIAVGVRLGYISERYDLIGHQQVSATECPGEAFFEEIMEWDRFLPKMKESKQ